MKKILGILLSCALIASAFTGCASNNGVVAPSGSSAPVVYGKNGVPMPDWVASMNKRASDVHYEVGYGKMSNVSTSTKKAESDARNKIAMWIQADVQTVLKTYTQDAGIGNNREVIDFMEEVSIQTAKVSLSGCEIEEMWTSAQDEVYVLMAYPISSAANNFQKQVNTYARNEAAAFAEFKADEAFAALQASNAEKAASGN